MTITTERLILRPMRLDDAEAMVRYRSIPEIASIIYSPVWDLAAAQAHIERLLPKLDDPNSGFCRWMIERRDEPGVMGDVILSRNEESPSSWEVGYILHPDFHGKGYATEAVRAVMDYGFSELGAHRIYARVDEENQASAGVAQKMGMRLEARLIESDVRDGNWSTELIFAILDREWKGEPL